MSATLTAPHTGLVHALGRPGLAFAWVLATLISTGCAVLPTPSLVDRATAPPHTIACADWYTALDAQTDLPGVRDAGAVRVAGFPHLRVDRFAASLLDTLPADSVPTVALPGTPAAATGSTPRMGSTGSHAPHIAALLARLQQLDLEARRFELANLPPQALAQLAGNATTPPNPAALWQYTQDCAQHLGAYTLASHERTASLLQRIHVADDYATSYRLLGVYALTRYPFASGIRRFEAERSAVFASAQATQPRTTRLLLSPSAQPPAAKLSTAHIRRMLAPPPQDPLRVPAPTPEQAQQLLAHFAPSFNLAIESDDDKPGALVWRQGLSTDAQDTLEVDTQTPVVYSQVAHTRYGPHSLLQLVYTLWFPARPVEPGKTLDLLAGKLDGITWRITLAPDGTPLVYDTIHPCGCYHMFFPTIAAQAKPAPQPGIEWAFIPQYLPSTSAQQQLVVHVAAGTHYIDRVSVEPVDASTTATMHSTTVTPPGKVSNASSSAHYAWRSYDSLRSLPTTAVQGAAAASKPAHRSVFGPDGFIAGTDRPERFIFWPMGIPRAGAMRQWGKHATAFVGRRHFDDATLMEQRFAFDPKHFRP
jgi:hypothetical protein